MSHCRIYGKSPYQIALLHGGPGAAGTLKTLAEMLANDHGVLELIQTKDSLDGQVEEIKKTLDEYADIPISLIGHSWGAMLGFIFTAKYPSYVSQLIMIGSGSFDSQYAKNIMQTTLSRLSQAKQQQLEKVMSELNEKASDELFHLLGKLTQEADTFDALPSIDTHIMQGQYHIYQSVWPQASKLRETGELLALGKNITCPVMSIHGNYDPHPYQGVQEPLSTVLRDFTFILLDKCGHEPWIERQARDEFMKIIQSRLHFSPVQSHKF